MLSHYEQLEKAKLKDILLTLVEENAEVLDDINLLLEENNALKKQIYIFEDQGFLIKMQKKAEN